MLVFHNDFSRLSPQSSYTTLPIFDIVGTATGTVVLTLHVSHTETERASSTTLTIHVTDTKGVDIIFNGSSNIVMSDFNPNSPLLLETTTQWSSSISSGSINNEKAISYEWSVEPEVLSSSLLTHRYDSYYLPSSSNTVPLYIMLKPQSLFENTQYKFTLTTHSGSNMNHIY